MPAYYLINSTAADVIIVVVAAASVNSYKVGYGKYQTPHHPKAPHRRSAIERLALINYLKKKTERHNRIQFWNNSKSNSKN